ncbi:MULTISPECIES: pyridoxamine 5'-phosphate oxidase family protein [Haloarcula]|uniref:pyridoxamine 5'-phosphate oxidase family protein n=1 Tax=Haloarcula TaxID=2237 RepID=UPI0023EC68D0|nr:pyridoxamine 5'-phosphate oxidase family protein [Halomicroarcula sp. XH51]
MVPRDDVIDGGNDPHEAEADALLDRHETAVLSLTDSTEPYATPTAYGYEADACGFFLRPAPPQRTERRAVLSTGPRARVIVYEAAPPIYRNVVAVGTLQGVSRSELPVEHREQCPRVRRERGARDRPKLKRRLDELEPTAVSGRRIETVGLTATNGARSGGARHSPGGTTRTLEGRHLSTRAVKRRETPAKRSLVRAGFWGIDTVERCHLVSD